MEKQQMAVSSWVQALANALSSGSAQDLIALDVRGNPLSDRGRELLGRLAKDRKQIKVSLGGF
jgi:uncharacterized protein YoaH (UPF0181 family)